jgi:hypothetical protein
MGDSAGGALASARVGVVLSSSMVFIGPVVHLRTEGESYRSGPVRERGAMTRIPDDSHKWGPVAPETPSVTEDKPVPEASGNEPVAGPDFLRLLQMEVASLPNRQLAPEVLARSVVDWWLQQYVPSRSWPAPVLKAFREQVVEFLQRDPLLQALIQKLST